MSLGAWGTRGLEEPARNLAARLVEQHNLQPPVDVEKLILEFADLSYEDWPYPGCDALVHDLHSPRPHVFVNSGMPKRRLRLTLAHEYGHIRMAWHLGILGCKPIANQLEPDDGGQSPVRKFDPVRALAAQEKEATRFAGYLLLPDSFIYPLIAGADMEALLRAMNKAEISADAALMRLRPLLQPGFAFTHVLNGERRMYASPGTELPGMNGGYDISRIMDLSYEHGDLMLSDRRVQWFRLADFNAFRPVHGKETATHYLRAAISAHEPKSATQQRLLQSINGVVGGSLSADRAESPEQALATLRHKFDFKPEYGAITEEPAFDIYLRKKVGEWAKKRGLL